MVNYEQKFFCVHFYELEKYESCIEFELIYSHCLILIINILELNYVLVYVAKLLRVNLIGM